MQGGGPLRAGGHAARPECSVLLRVSGAIGLLLRLLLLVVVEDAWRVHGSRCSHSYA